MLTPQKHSKTGGFTLIELVIAIAIMAIAMGLGLPGFMDWIQNTQIRTAAESISAGLQAARNEAIRRNTPIEFTLTGNGGTGETGWQIVVRNTGEAIQAQAAGEGSRSATLVTTPADARTVTFTGLGRVSGTNADATPVLTQINIDNPALDATNSRDLQIGITSGGAIRMCDPNMTISGDPRKC